jgi:hypothetical protein
MMMNKTSYHSPIHLDAHPYIILSTTVLSD